MLILLICCHSIARPPTRSSVKNNALSTLESMFNFRIHFVSHILICRFLIHFFMLATPNHCYPRHSHHPSPLYFSYSLSFQQITLTIDYWKSPDCLHGLITGLLTGFFTFIAFPSRFFTSKVLGHSANTSTAHLVRGLTLRELYKLFDGFPNKTIFSFDLETGPQYLRTLLLLGFLLLSDFRYQALSQPIVMKLFTHTSNQ